MLDLNDSSYLLRLLAEPTRLRLLLLLSHEPLTVAELTAVTRLTQSRISSHLARLKKAGLVMDGHMSSAGNCYHVQTQYWPREMQPLWELLSERIDDIQLARDRERASEIIRRRTLGGWAESVAGRMEKQYSPGRTWEAMSRSMIELLNLGAVLDIGSGDGVLAELLSPRSRQFVCLDVSQAVIQAARQRLADRANVNFRIADMHDLPWPDAQFDQIFMLHTLSFSTQPERAISEAARVLKPGGRIVLATIAQHSHEATVAAYDHVNLGFLPSQLHNWLQDNHLRVQDCAIRSRERQPPFFRLITASADKP